MTTKAVPIERILGWALLASPLAFLSLSGLGLVRHITGQWLNPLLTVLWAGGALILYAGPGLRFARGDPLGFWSIGAPGLLAPFLGFVTGVGTAAYVADVLFLSAFLLAGHRTWPIWRRVVLRRRFPSPPST
jgi:hypothetical protein